MSGAWEQARTADPSLFRGVLYQLSYPSKYDQSMRAIVPVFAIIATLFTQLTCKTKLILYSFVREAHQGDCL